MDGFELLNLTDFYIGSYGAHPFWVGNHIDIYDPEQAELFRGIIPDFAVKLKNEYFKAAICVNGLMLLRIEHLARSMPYIADPIQYNFSAHWMDKYLDYVNTMQLCVESESIKCVNSYEIQSTATRANDICKVGMLNGTPRSSSFNHRYGQSQFVVMNELKIWITKGATWPSPLEVNGWRLPHEFISIEAAKNALETFSVVANDEQQVRWLSYLVKAKTAYAENDYRMSFILSWFVIESSIQWLFNASAPGKQKTRTVEMIDFLRIEGLISEETELCLDHLRRLRNNLMHKPAETVCPPDDCIKAGQAAIALAVRNSNITLVSSWRSSVQF
ncbi:hypothetical protein [Acerihabitans arboris]|uniref:Apea-like HEPN domain-containing protein n=1 Tax=Acerihabitans arboris TaxID=2691583 RepID=A0A845SJP5_9GAMM|nr:hypothetical protein [Acerihabitans arboris]NDL63226.1 hypothetical protein [Acerihabitans arboris]